jgi:hypothetical protein
LQVRHAEQAGATAVIIVDFAPSVTPSTINPSSFSMSDDGTGGNIGIPAAVLVAKTPSNSSLTPPSLSSSSFVCMLGLRPAACAVLLDSGENEDGGGQCDAALDVQLQLGLVTSCSCSDAAQLVWRNLSTRPSPPLHLSPVAVSMASPDLPQEEDDGSEAVFPSATSAVAAMLARLLQVPSRTP